MRSFVFGALGLATVATLSACGTNTPTGPSAAAQPTAAASPASAEGRTAGAKLGSATDKAVAKPAQPRQPAKPAQPAKSDLGELERLGIDLNEGVLIDVADDGVDRWMQVGRNGVDFTGTTRTDSTMMSLKAAPVREKNRVLIQPPFWNEEVGAGHCVADTAGAALRLEVCKRGKAAQVWTIVPAGDSGQFELHGKYGVIRVEDGKITTGGSGRTGLQTIRFAS
ncbi:hypothetical protein ACIBSW_17815 [Actinoplanes sp. NPDC049668]|uniref:hypothetical protein n=1 Tax=unclassified Actinoplanes TaxID=2626549 RepID=UPI00339EE0EF